MTPFPLIAPSDALTLLFAAALMMGVAIKFWLASRQIRHVARHRSEVPPAFSGRISLEAHEKAADYTIAKSRLALVDTALSLCWLVGWTLLGGLSSLNQWLLSVIEPGLLQQLALMACFVVVNAVLELPVSLYQTFVLEQRFGFNKMTPQLWFADLVRSTLVGLLIGLPIAGLILWVMGSTGTSWWLWAWAIWMSINLLLMMVYPTFIAPLFNKFEPLADETIKSRVTQLMHRCGFAAKGLFVMDGSKRSAHANAYFTGFGASKRVVFYDTLLKKLSPGEIDAVLAHELGHFKHKHVNKRIVTLFAGSFLGLALLGWLSGQIWFYTGLGAQPQLMGGPNDALALLLFVLCAPALTFFISPLFARVSRSQEFEADDYAMAQANSEDLASALLKLYQDNASTLTPDPLFVKFYYSHPPASERLGRMRLTNAIGTMA
ncbi:MAG: hypothetical protein RLZZ591_539 [Pseudomonadota bacterium]|jgi:STE24 endopeptidase